MTLLKDLKASVLKDDTVRAEYEARQDNYAIASKLIAARLKAGLTQAEVAERADMKQATISKLESGNHKPSYRSIERYAHATGHRAVVTLEPT